MPAARTRRVALYARVSPFDQTTGHQIVELRRDAETRGSCRRAAAMCRFRIQGKHFDHPRSRRSTSLPPQVLVVEDGQSIREPITDVRQPAGDRCRSHAHGSARTGSGPGRRRRARWVRERRCDRRWPKPATTSSASWSPRTRRRASRFRQLGRCAYSSSSATTTRTTSPFGGTTTPSFAAAVSTAQTRAAIQALARVVSTNSNGPT